MLFIVLIKIYKIFRNKVKKKCINILWGKLLKFYLKILKKILVKGELYCIFYKDVNFFKIYLKV